MSNQIEKLGSELSKMASSEVELQAKIMDATADLQVQVIALQEKQKEVRDAIYTAMLDNDVPEYEDDRIKIKLMAPSEREGIDLKKLKVLHPDIVEKFRKVTQVKGHVRMSLKD